MKSFLSKSTITAGIVLSAAIVSNPAMAASFVVTAEAPGVQQSNLFTNPNAYGAKNVYEETFDSKSTGYNTTASAFGDPAQNIGSYDQSVIVNANQYGGANGTGNYLTVQPSSFGTSQDSTKSETTLTLNSSQRYFGLWWSAGDPNNEMDFLSGGKVVEKFTTADVINFISQQPNSNSYYGNPNSAIDPTTGKRVQNSGEPYAFLNFFADPNDQSVTFDQVVFINNSTDTGFESDNHTVVSSYTNISGKNIAAPEPSAALGLGIIAGIGMLSQRKKIVSKA
ncbi:MAG: PEP-CTERM sorting domain-containing protein [Stigonema ocellatum SAG 48.90 = DSM 106950]|nr:PEP-CTERM sorting domain-containing protein [Stigonema ocellatum SAG 48.90 = DSM 106950]